MILTLTPNPSVDRTVHVAGLVRGEVHRSDRSSTEPSGKGVNVSLALHAHGHRTRAVLPVGGPVGVQLTELLQAAGLDATLVPVAGAVRSNISIAEPDGTVTKVNEAGPVLDPAEVEALVRALDDHLALGDVRWLVLAGSLPGGVPEDLYARICRAAHSRGVTVAVDTSGPALRASLAAGPDLVKPNSHELTELVGHPLHTLTDVVRAAEQVRRDGAGAVLASLGADGAVLVDAEGALHGEAAVERVVSAVGAGDAMIAGFLAGSPGRHRALRTALQWGAAAVQHEGTLFKVTGEGAAVVLHDRLDADRVLSG